MPPLAVDTDKTATKHNGIEQQAVTLRGRRYRRMPGMGTVVHFIKTGSHIKEMAAIVHQRDVNGRTPTVIGTNRDIDNILRVGTGIPQYRLRLLGAIRVVHHKLQAGQLRNADAFSQRGYRLGV